MKPKRVIKSVCTHKQWMKDTLLQSFRWKKLSAEEKKIRITRDILLLLLAYLTSLLHWACFTDSNLPPSAAAILSLFYLIPITAATILYGLVGGIAVFTPAFIFAVILSPSDVYLFFFHLIAMYTFNYLYQRKMFVSAGKTLYRGIFSGVFLSVFFYLIFGLVASESLSEASFFKLMMHAGNVIPQSILICYLIYFYIRKVPERVKKAIGADRKYEADIILNSREPGACGRVGIGRKIFSLLLFEAIFMGIAAAFFANSLIPKLMTNYVEEGTALSASVQEDAEEATENETVSLDAFSEMLRDVGMDATFEAGRSGITKERFTYNDQGLSFDIKLVLILLCVIHPIVFLFNYFGQQLIARPIADMAKAVEGFTEDEESRREVEHSLAQLQIRSEDETEDLYGVLYSMISELNSYIEDMKREQQLKEDLRVAQAASEAKSSFLSNVSHEIRTPINAVLGLDEMILRESREEPIRKYAADIRNSGKTLLALINDLLDFSKIEAGKMEILPVEYELSSVINDLINMVASKAADKGLELKVDVDRMTPHVLYGDEIRIKQCILNILNNAVKYTPKGSVSMSFRFWKISEEEIALTARVVDTGIGIREEDLEKLYSPFERIEESRNRTIEGTGLGMSITRQLLEMMGSRLEVKSVYGEGSDFSFEVVQHVVKWEPIGDFNETYERSLQAMEQYRVSFVAPEGRVLVVDDTPMNLTVICGLLKETLLQVDTALSGAESIEKIRKTKYDIIFMDQRMPEMDGCETLQAIRALSEEENLCKDAVMICLTANVVSGAREMFLQAGFDDYLGKPIDAVKLEKMLAEHLPKDLVFDPESPEGKRALAEAGAEALEEAGTAGSGFLSKLRTVEGIDADAALTNCLKEEILEEAVRDFRVSLKTVPDKIEEYWRSGDLRNYTITVHALKSSSRLIGALGLSELAARLEACGDAGDTDAIDERTPELLTLYRSFDERLGIFSEETAEDTREEIPPEQLAEAYGALRESVEAFDFDTADELIGMLKAYRMPANEAERFEKLCDLVTRLEREELLKELG